MHARAQGWVAARSARAGLFALMLLGILPVHAKAQGMRIHMHAGGGYAADGTLYEPHGQAPFASILLIPDERGILERVTDTALQLAAAGFVVVAVDLNRGEPADMALHTAADATHDLEAALTFLSAQSNVRRDSVGAVCWGSGCRYAFELAADSKLRALATEGYKLPPTAASGRPIHGAVLGVGVGDTRDHEARRLREFFVAHLN